MLRKCRHHWLIQTTARAFTMGVCTLCGEQREFKNDIWARPEDRFISDRPKKERPEKPAKESGRARLTIEDFRRWGKMGGRGHKKQPATEPVQATGDDSSQAVPLAPGKIPAGRS